MSKMRSERILRIYLFFLVTILFTAISCYPMHDAADPNGTVVSDVFFLVSLPSDMIFEIDVPALGRHLHENLHWPGRTASDDIVHPMPLLWKPILAGTDAT